MNGAVLIVEDDPAMAVALRDGFEYEGFKVEVARDGSAGLQLATESTPDLIVLDVMLPKMSGFDVCKQLRHAGNQTPIIMLTARGQEVDKVVGLKLGADDYVTKPFSFMELMARVEALLRRVQRAAQSTGTSISPPVREDELTFADVTISFKRFEAHKAGQALDLSPREFRILKHLGEHRGEVITRDELLDAVWGYSSFPLTRTVDMHIAKLRQKIEDHPHDPRHIITIHRVGYKFVV